MRQLNFKDIQKLSEMAEFEGMYLWVDSSKYLYIHNLVVQSTTWLALEKSYDEFVRTHPDTREAREIAHAATLMSALCFTTFIEFCRGNYLSANALLRELLPFV